MTYQYKPLTVRQLLEAITDEFERTINENERPKGGMQVPFHGDFAQAVRMPTVIGRMRWWVREFRRALDEEKENEGLHTTREPDSQGQD